jgi:hypothetical protein
MVADDRLPQYQRCPKCNSIMTHFGGTRFKLFVPDLQSCPTCGWSNESLAWFNAVTQQWIYVYE